MPTKTRTKRRRPDADSQVKPPAASLPEASLRLPTARFARAVAISVVLALGTALLYAPVAKHPFMNYDDQVYVYENSHVKAGLTWETIAWALTSTDESNWHPVTWLSHALDYQLFGLNPTGHHLMNVAIHALNVALLFLLLWRVTGATWPSFVVAALFAVHPLNVESVAWVAERKNVLSTLFFLLTLGAYGWYARKPTVQRYLTVALLFVLGLAAKPMVITLPFVLLLIDYWPLQRIKHWSEPSLSFPVPQRRFWTLVAEKLPLLVLSAGSAVVTIVAQDQAHSVVYTGLLPISVRVENALYAYGMYLWKAVWPARLAFVYPHPGHSLAAWKPALALFVIVLLSAVAWRQRFARPYLVVGWLWFLGTAVPVIGIVQVGVQVIADRYAYVPLLGIFVMVAWEAVSLADRRRLGVVPRDAAIAVILAALSFLTWRQIGYWRSSVDLWTHTVQVTGDNMIAESNLAGDLFTLGRDDEAIPHLRNYARLQPLDPLAHAQLAADYQDHGQLAEAVREYQASLRAAGALRRTGVSDVDPAMWAVTSANLSVTYAQLGETAKARESMARALQADAAAVDQMMGEQVQSLRVHATAQGYLRLGILLHLVGHTTESQQALAIAQRLNPQVVLPTIGLEGGSAQP
jgi:protein O-mannosyl-transferase